MSLRNILGRACLLTTCVASCISVGCLSKPHGSDSVARPDSAARPSERTSPPSGSHASARPTGEDYPPVSESRCPDEVFVPFATRLCLETVPTHPEMRESLSTWTSDRRCDELRTAMAPLPPRSRDGRSCSLRFDSADAFTRQANTCNKPRPRSTRCIVRYVVTDGSRNN